jgi:hypothetical protein
VDAVLRARRVDPHQREDVIQEVAVRALEAHRNGTITSSFDAWCKGTARHVLADSFRSRTRTDVTDQPPDAVSREATEERVLGRLSLDGFFSAWQTLEPAEKAQLLATDFTQLDGPGRNRAYVALHRLRRHVRAMSERATLALLGLAYRLRRIRAGHVAVGAAACAFTAAAVLLQTPAHETKTPRARQQRVVSSTAPSAPTPEKRPGAAATRRVPVAGQPASDFRLSVPLPGREPVSVYTEPSKPDDPLLCITLPPAAAPAWRTHFDRSPADWCLSCPALTGGCDRPSSLVNRGPSEVHVRSGWSFAPVFGLRSPLAPLVAPSVVP